MTIDDLGMYSRVTAICRENPDGLRAIEALAQFCDCDTDRVASDIERILRARERGGKEVCFRRAEDHETLDLSGRTRIMPLGVLAYFTQAEPEDVKRIFLVPKGLKSSALHWPSPGLVFTFE